MKKILYGVLSIVVVLFIIFLVISSDSVESNQYDIGFVGAITGPVAKYGAYEGASLAVEEINAKGGIKGKKINLIAEDGQCNTAKAVSAVNKLVSIDKVKVILGGHCTPESIVVAEAAGKHKVAALASITSSPMFTAISPYFARTTWLSVEQSPIIAEYLFDVAKISTISIVYEQSDYARPIAEKLKDSFEGKGGRSIIYESFVPGSNDFRSILAKVKNSESKALFVAVQAPDTIYNIFKQAKELGMNNIKFIGNDVVNVQANIDKDTAVYEGVMFVSVDFDVNNPKTKKFLESYKSKFGVDVSSGMSTAESYDAVYIIADALDKYGLDAEKISFFLHNEVKDFDGASGKITINKDGDGVRSYSMAMRVIRSGKVENL